MQLFKKLLYLVVFSFGVLNIHGQNINTFNYQAVAHDPISNQILANQDLNVKFYIGINNQDPENDYIYSEEHDLTTNEFGLFYTKIGNEDPGIFSDIQWGIDTYYLTVVIDNNLVSTDLMVAVPYSIASNNANTVNNLSVESAVPANATFTDNQSLNITTDSLVISNGSGVPLSDLGGNNWTLDVDDMYNNNSGRIGVGINNFTNMGGKLNVVTDSDSKRGVYILNSTASVGTSPNDYKMGIYAMADGSGNADNYGGMFESYGQSTGEQVGVGGQAHGSNSTRNIGVFGSADGNNNGNNFAGYFGSDNYPGTGNVKINDKLTVGDASNYGQFQFIDGNQGPNRILKSDANGNAQWVQIGSLGIGVMLKSIYDTNNNSIVDNAETVNGFQVGTNVPANADFSDDQQLGVIDYDSDGVNDSITLTDGGSIAISDIQITPNIAINDLADGYTDNNNNLYLVSVPGNISSSAIANIGIGNQALNSNVSGTHNVAIGVSALEQSTGVDAQVAIGANALRDNTTGDRNNALGYFALSNNTTGQLNNAFGYSALSDNTTGNANSGFGQWALRHNTTGYGNTAFGVGTLYENTSGNTNTAVGHYSLQNNQTGNYNTAIGDIALKQNTTGDGNVAVGHKALENNTTGEFNVSIGSYSLQQNTTSSSNIAIGERALDNNTSGQENVAVGRYALTDNTTGSNNTAIGFNASVGSNNLTNATAIGANTTVNTSNAVVIGNNANVGIGISSPAEKLDVDGKIRMRSGANDGYIALSDSNGVMTWTNPASVLPAGDMNTSDYDTNNDGIVDNAETVNGYQVGTNVPANADFSDDQQLSTNGLDASNVVRVNISNGNYIDINLSALNNPGSDNQDLTGANFNQATGVLTIDIQNGNSISVNLSTLTNTDNQNLGLTSDSLTISGGRSVALKDISTTDDDWQINNNDMYSGKSGNVGIGINNPSAKLNVRGPDNSTLLKLERNGVSGNGLGITYKGNTEGYEIKSEDLGGISLEASGSNEIRFETDGQERMHIDANGNILVGNSGSTPSTTMDVSGSLTVQQDAQSNGGDVFFKNLPTGYNYNYQAVMVDTTDGKLYRMSSDDGWGGSPGNSIWTESGSNIHYNSGNVGIGTSSPDFKLEIEKNQSFAISNSFGMTNTSNCQNCGTSIGFKSKFISSDWIQAKISGYTYDQSISKGALKFEVMNNRSNGNMITPLTISGDGKITFNESSNSYIFPTSRGTDGQVLTVGSTPGQLEWTNPGSGGGGSIWTSSGSDIHYNSGNVGIGVSSPNKKLEVSGESKFIGNVIIGGSSGSGSYVTLTASGSTPSSLNGRYDQATGYIFDLSDSEIETSQNAVYFFNSSKNAGFFYAGSPYYRWVLVTGVTPGSDNSASNYYTTTLWGSNTGYCDGSCPSAGSVVYTASSGNNYELNTSHGGNANMVPVAYGTVSNSGSKLNDASTPNFNVTRNNIGIYTVNFNDFNFDGTKYMVSCAIKSNNLGHIIYYQDGTNLKIKTFDSQGSLSNRGFSFLVFHP